MRQVPPAQIGSEERKGWWKYINPSDDCKLTGLDCLIDGHHLQTIKAFLPYLGVPEQKAISLFVKVQELKKIMKPFEIGEVTSMDICSLDRPQGKSSLRDLLEAVRPYGNSMEQGIIGMAETLMEGQTSMGQLRKLPTPEQQPRFETMEMMLTAMQAMA